MKKLSLYIHIPFCIQKCRYCDFYSAPAGEREMEEYTGLLCREIEVWGRHLNRDYRPDTIFLGGGTPSCLPLALQAQIGEALERGFDCSRISEYTIEANPGTVTREHTVLWTHMGINRVSVGLQSAQNQELQSLGRIHDYPHFLSTYEMLRSGGMTNINIDIMSAIPGQTVESYQDTLEKVISLHPEHISAYSLIVEPGTVFGELEQQGKLERPNEETDRVMYQFTRQYFREQGYHRYEISNYALSGKECRHNCVYWTGGEYLGLGVNASSYLGGYRFTVPRGQVAYETYVEALEQGREPWEMFAAGNSLLPELIKTDARMRMEEFMFLGLRMTQGVSFREFYQRFSREMGEVYGDVIEKMTSHGLLEIIEDGERLRLTDRGIDVSNPVLAEFLLE